MRIEDISRLVGHSASGATERIHQHELHAILPGRCDVMDELFPLDDAE